MVNEPEVAVRSGKSPSELFAAYLTEREENDADLAALFAELHAEATSGETGG